MGKKSIQSDQAGWALLRLALLTNQLQERKDNQQVEEQAKSQLTQRHRHEMAQISLFLNPLGWTRAIARYRAQQAENLLLHKSRHVLILTRQQKDRLDLEQWIAQQQDQSSEFALFTQLQTLFDWSLTAHQRQSYQQALNQGNTLIITDAHQLILWVNQSFTSLTGYESSEVVGHSPQLLQGLATNRTTVQYIREQLSSAQVVEADLLNYRKNGTPYGCHMRIEPLYSCQGTLTHFVAIEREVKLAAGKKKGTQTVV